MKRLIISFAAILACVYSFAQSESERYEQRYDLLVSKLGPAGVGIETVLDNWEKVDSTNARMLVGRFSYLFTKAQTPKVVTRGSKKYLGMDPVLSLKDSLGNDVYYFQDNVFDDEIYALAVKAADKAVAIHPDRLDFRFMKVNAYIAYEKESPDMALAYLLSLVKENAGKTGAWNYDGEEADPGFFEDAMQEYCYSFYTIGSTASQEAFLALSECLTGYFPSNMGFVNNIGSYHLLKRDYKGAMKIYDKVLKKVPDDYTAMQNGLLAARKMKNLKAEKKYLNLIVRYGSEKDRLLAKGRLDALNSK